MRNTTPLSRYESDIQQKQIIFFIPNTMRAIEEQQST
jgi:hypothetical protein